MLPISCEKWRVVHTFQKAPICVYTIWSSGFQETRKRSKKKKVEKNKRVMTVNMNLLALRRRNLVFLQYLGVP